MGDQSPLHLSSRILGAEKHIRTQSHEVLEAPWRPGVPGTPHRSVCFFVLRGHWDQIFCTSQPRGKSRNCLKRGLFGAFSAKLLAEPSFRILRFFSSQAYFGDKFGESQGGSQAPRASGKSPIKKLPRKFPELPRKFFGDFPGSSLTVELNSNAELPRKFPKLPRKFPDFPGGQPLSLGSLTPSPDSQKLSLNTFAGTRRKNTEGKNT